MASHNGNGARRKFTGETLAKGLGWFSVALGVAQIAAPRRMAGMIGANASPGMMRFIGFRELTTGIGILSQSKPAGWVQARVAGDAMDLGLLGAAFMSRNPQPSKLAAATAAVAGVTALDIISSRQLQQSPGLKPGEVHVKHVITINRSPEEIYRFWHNFEELPRFMNHLESVRVTGDKQTHWVAKGPAGMKVEWDAETTEDRPNEQISWRSLPGARVDNSGTVRFERARGNRGTVVNVELVYRPPAGRLGAAIAKMFGEAPEKQIKVDLLRLKQLLETGEIARTEGQPAGRATSLSPKFDIPLRH